MVGEFFSMTNVLQFEWKTEEWNMLRVHCHHNVTIFIQHYPNTMDNSCRGLLKCLHQSRKWSICFPLVFFTLRTTDSHIGYQVSGRSCTRKEHRYRMIFSSQTHYLKLLIIECYGVGHHNFS